MALTNEEWRKLYTASIENRKDILWIRNGMDRHNLEIEKCREGVKALEIDRGFQRGKIVFLAASVTAVLTIATNAALWMFGYFGGIK